ncbi:MAG: aminotransferase class I/II-fold pyridoxal phosphate-dependent enzyme, partial [Pseudomonadota bacterium]
VTGRERELVDEVFESNFIAPAGPMLGRFESAFSDLTGIDHCVALSSGTAAMHLALRLIGVGEGDEVWTSTLTFIGGPAPITYLGAKPVFFDVDIKTGNIDCDLLEHALEQAAQSTSLPKAIVPVDLYGTSCDLDRIIGIAEKYEIPVVCDSAEGVGTRYKDRHAGNGAAISVYSFNGNKMITASGGGMLACDNPKWAERARFLATQAREPFAHYEHETVGYNYRMSNVMAAIGLGQLETLDQKIDRRRAIFARYESELGGLEGLEFLREPEFSVSTRWLTVILLDPEVSPVTPVTLMERLIEQEIEARPLWKPMHLQPVFSHCRFYSSGNSESLFARGLCLPSGSGMSEVEQTKVIHAIRSAWNY